MIQNQEIRLHELEFDGQSLKEIQTRIQNLIIKYGENSQVETRLENVGYYEEHLVSQCYLKQIN